MAFDHACFISFSRGPGKDSQFADHFFEEFRQQLAAMDKTLSVFKFDRREERRQGDAWDLWIQRELCKSAMLIAVCAPNYFNGSPGCVSEFRGMEQLITARTGVLGVASTDWLVGLRLKDTVPMPALDPYPVVDFLDCFATPQNVRRLKTHRMTVERLVDRVYQHWQWLHDANRHATLAAANLCAGFLLPAADEVGMSDLFPRTGGVR